MEQIISEGVFQLKKFIIPEFSFTEPKSNFINLNIDFKPSGLYNPSTCEFTIVMETIATATTADKSESFESVRLTSLAVFQFEKGTTNIPDFFYSNGIAIVFPYIRAFVSSMTLQAGIRHIILPVLNLTSLEKGLRDKTTILK